MLFKGDAFTLPVEGVLPPASFIEVAVGSMSAVSFELKWLLPAQSRDQVTGDGRAG
jgi:hypothetical protein